MTNEEVQALKQKAEAEAAFRADCVSKGLRGQALLDAIEARKEEQAKAAKAAVT